MVLSGYVIVVADKNGKDLYGSLKEKYANDDWVHVILSSESYDFDESNIHILVGDTVEIDEKINKASGIVIDLSDSKIMDMINSTDDLAIVRNQLIDGITLHKDILVGVDYIDIQCVLQGHNNISVGIIRSKSTFDASDLVNKLIAKAKVDISRCKSAYLYVDGDIGLMGANELANALRASMLEGTNIVYDVSYDSSVVDEFYVMVLFGN